MSFVHWCIGALTICLAKPVSWYLHFWVDLPTFLSSWALQSCFLWLPSSSFSKLKSVLLKLQVSPVPCYLPSSLQSGSWTILVDGHHNQSCLWLSHLQPVLFCLRTPVCHHFGPSSMYIKELSLISSKNYLGCLCPTVLPFQWMSGKLKSLHEHQGLWFRDFFELWRRLHLISPCLSGDSVMYSQHHVILTGDSSDPDLQTVWGFSVPRETFCFCPLCLWGRNKMLL